MVIGTTRLGNRIKVDPFQIPEHVAKEITLLAVADQFDAHCAFQYMAIWAKRKYGEKSREFKYWKDVNTAMINQLTPEDISTLFLPCLPQLENCPGDRIEVAKN